MAPMVGRAVVAAAATRKAKARRAAQQERCAIQTNDENRPPLVCATNAQDLKASSSHLSAPATEAPERYLCRFGLGPGDQPRPQLEIRIQDGGHTFAGLYNIECTLGAVGEKTCKFSSMAWKCKRRTSDLRSALHDAVKAALGQEGYEAHFGQTPFARHVGVPGTTARLKAWMASLAACVNAGHLDAQVLVHVLRSLEAPLEQEGDVQMKGLDRKSSAAAHEEEAEAHSPSEPPSEADVACSAVAQEEKEPEAHSPGSPPSEALAVSAVSPLADVTRCAGADEGEEEPAVYWEPEKHSPGSPPSKALAVSGVSPQADATRSVVADEDEEEPAMYSPGSPPCEVLVASFEALVAVVSIPQADDTRNAAEREEPATHSQEPATHSQA